MRSVNCTTVKLCEFLVRETTRQNLKMSKVKNVELYKVTEHIYVQSGNYTYTVRKVMKCSGEAERLHELVHDIRDNQKVMNKFA